MKKSLVKNAIYNVIYSVANILFSFFTSIYVSRILFPTGVGRVASAQNIAYYFSMIAALGLPSYGIREFAKIREIPDEKDKLFTELILINIISTTLAIAGFWVLVLLNRGFNGEWKLYFVCGLTIFFNYINIDWIYKGLEEYGYITGRNLMIKIISFIILILGVRTQKDYVIYALISSLAAGGNNIFNVIYARKFVRLNFDHIDLRKHLKPVIMIAFIILLSGIYNNIDITMLNLMGTEQSVGYYIYAHKTINIIFAFVSAITAALLPRLSYYYDNDKNNFYQLLNKGFQVVCFIGIPFCVGLMLVAPGAVKILYGEAFAPAALTIRISSPLILIKSFGDLFCYQLVYSVRSEKIILPASICAVIVNVIMNMILIPKFLQDGAVIASVFSEWLTNFIQYRYIKKKITFHLKMKALYQSIGTTTIMTAVVFAIMQLNIPDTVSFIIEVCAGVGIYTFANLILKNELLIKIIDRYLKKQSESP